MELALCSAAILIDFLATDEFGTGLASALSRSSVQNWSVRCLRSMSLAAVMER